MIPSAVRSLSAAQWLQGLSAKGAPSQTGTQSNKGSAELLRDSTSISARAFQLNQAAGTSLKTHSAAARSSGVSTAQDDHRHHGIHAHASATSVGTDVAQADASDRAARGDASAKSVGDPSLLEHRGSFVQEVARKAANDVRAAYSATTAPEAASLPNHRPRVLSVTA